MKKILLGLIVCISTVVLSQDKRNGNPTNDLKIGTYDNQHDSKDSLGIFIAKPYGNGTYSLCLDVLLSKRKNMYGAVGIAIAENEIDRFFSKLRVAKKEFENRLNSKKKSVDQNMKIGGQNPVRIYKWESEDINGPTNRMDKKMNQKLYPLSIEIITAKDKTELWIYTNGETSSEKEIAIILDSVENVTQFVNLFNPGAVRQKYNNHFNIKGKRSR